MNQPARNRRAGMALLVVIVLVMFVSLAAYRYSFEMENEYRLTRLQEEQTQARLCSLSGIEFAAGFLEQPLAVRQAWMVGEEPSRFFTRSIERISSDSSTASKGLGPLSNQSAPVWRFAILGGRTTGDSSAGVLANDTKRDWEWGLENESAKIHIPSLLRWNQAQPGIARSFLLTLPEADEDMVDAWLSMLGVKSPNMEARDAIQSAPAGLASNLIREQEQKALDRVRLRWLGGDLDQNYQVDPWEESLLEKILFDPQGASPAQAKMAKELSKVSAIAMKAEETSEQSQDMPKAWSRYLTWVQGERNERPDGRPRIDINQPDLKKLHQELSQVLSLAEANFLIAVRQYGTAVSKRPQSLSAIQSQSTNQSTNASRSNSQAGLNSPTALKANAPMQANQGSLLPQNGAVANQDERRTRLPLVKVDDLYRAEGAPRLTPEIPQQAPAQPVPAQPAQAQSSSTPAVPSAASAKSSSSSISSNTPTAPGNPQSNSTSIQNIPPEQWAPNWQIPAAFTIQNLLDLVDQSVNIPASSPSSGSSAPSASASSSGTSSTTSSTRLQLQSPYSLKGTDGIGRVNKLLQLATTVGTPILEGKIDFTAAPLVVLAMVPGLDPATARKIVQMRDESSSRREPITSLLWLLEKGIVDRTKLAELEAVLTARSDVFTLQSVGFRDERTPVYRSTVMIDARQIPAQVRNYRVWHPWDRGFSTEALAPTMP